MTIYIGGAAAIFVCLSLLLAVKDYAAVISGEDPDPVSTILNDAFGVVGTKVVLAVVMISFLSCALSLMAAASRLMYAYARDEMIAFSHLLRHFQATRHVPPYAMAVAAAVPAIIVLGSIFSTKALTSIISFATLGIYLGFQMVVLAALRARLKGWQPTGPFSLGRWGMPVNVAALTYGVLAMINMAWPRTPDAPWYDNWLVALSAAVGVGVGAIYLVLAKPYLRSDATAGDAVPVARTSSGNDPGQPGPTRRT
jgi:amino acid transporter